MPVPGRAFEAEVVLVAKVALHQADGDEEQHQHAHQHVEAVKARQHVEGGAENTGVELEVVVVVEMVVLVALHAEEDETQNHRHPHEADAARPVVDLQRMVGDGQRHARAQQQRRVDGGQPERSHGLEGLDNIRGRRRGTGGNAGPHGLKVGPQQLVGQAAQRRHRVRASPPQRSEEGAEEHHLREDEPAHAPAVGQVDLAAVEPGLAFARCIAEPDEQHGQPPDQTDEQGIHSPFVTIDPGACAQDHKEQTDGRHHGMAGFGWHIVVRGCALRGCTHHSAPDSVDRCFDRRSTITCTAFATPVSAKAKRPG